MVLKEIQEMVVNPFKVRELSLFLLDHIAQKGMEVRDVECVIPAAHGEVGHAIDDLLPALELLLQRCFVRAMDDEGRYGRGELVVNSLKMLLNTARV